MLTGGNISPGDKGYKCVLAPATLPGTTSGNDGVEEVEEGGSYWPYQTLHHSSLLRNRLS